MTTLDRSFMKAFEAPAKLTTPKQHVGADHVTVDQGAAGGSQFNIEVSVEAEVVETTLVDETEPAQAPPTGKAPAAEPSRPLSSYAAPTPKIHDSSQALLEVDRLIWPESCDALLERAKRQWQGFRKHLVERMGQGQKCLAFSSLERGDGRTTTTLALAKHMVAEGSRVVVVDADVENPALVRGCGISVQSGWDDLVGSELALGEALIAAPQDGLTLMPWRGGPVSLMDLATSLRTGRIFGTLREQYDLVLLDTLPLGAKATLDDLAAFARTIHLDALYLIQNVRGTSRGELASMCARVRRAGLPLTAIIENFVARPEDAPSELTVHG
ncbi:MAG: hypothetical protein DWQ37_02490 [Planctomycetota bacterium]|nr:MAG: hypothetical protein DWQ37_02490 [Planctomycetota bacterium]